MKKLGLIIATLILTATPLLAYTCPDSNPYHTLVNKENPLTSEFKPTTLVIPNVRFAERGNIDKNMLEETASIALEVMFQDAKEQGVNLVAVSGYRSYSRQAQLYRNAVNTHGKSQRGTAKEGNSEHQLGLSMDINSVSQSFSNTKEGKWLADNAHIYGFIIRYPKGKEHVTGYIYEPWHVRYVGNELANKCYMENLTLEELNYCCDPINISPITINGYIDSDFINKNGTGYVKLRDIAKAGSLPYRYIQEDGTVELKVNNATYTFKSESSEYLLDGELMYLSSPTLNVNESFYLPLRESMTNFNMSFYIDLYNKTLIINQGGIYSGTYSKSNIITKPYDGELLIFR